MVEDSGAGIKTSDRRGHLCLGGFRLGVAPLLFGLFKTEQDCSHHKLQRVSERSSGSHSSQGTCQ